MLFNVTEKTAKSMSYLESLLEDKPFRDRALKGIAAYKAFYDETAERQHWDEHQKDMSAHKYLHTLEVTHWMMEYSPSPEWDETYFWMGLLHDFGRVNDIGLKTFKGLAHPQAGAEMLFGKKMHKIDLFEVGEGVNKEALKWGVAFHGALSLEAEINNNNLDPSTAEYRMWKDIRTADKKDIFSFLLYTPTTVTIGGATPEDIASIPVSELTLYELTNDKPVDRAAEEYTFMRWFLSHVGFIYDNLDIRLAQWLIETGWVDKYFNLLPNPVDRKNLEIIRKKANEFLEKKVAEANK